MVFLEISLERVDFATSSSTILCDLCCDFFPKFGKKNLSAGNLACKLFSQVSFLSRHSSVSVRLGSILTQNMYSKRKNCTNVKIFRAHIWCSQYWQTETENLLSCARTTSPMIR